MNSKKKKGYRKRKKKTNKKEEKGKHNHFSFPSTQHTWPWPTRSPPTGPTRRSHDRRAHACLFSLPCGPHLSMSLHVAACPALSCRRPDPIYQPQPFHRIIAPPLMSAWTRPHCVSLGNHTRLALSKPPPGALAQPCNSPVHAPPCHTLHALRSRTARALELRHRTASHSGHLCARHCHV